MVSVNSIFVEFGGYTLLDNISYIINRQDRLALVGKNGVGKSTMLKILAGIQSPTKGNVSYPKDLTIGYLPQNMVHKDEHTLKEEVETAFEKVKELQNEIDRIGIELSSREDYESEEYQGLIDRMTLLSEHLNTLDSSSFAGEVEKTLLGLGFKRTDFDRSTAEFSGGWRMRIELAKILLQKPDLILLDEPTNHLDIESIQWLEKFLSTATQNAVVLVSHDRAFLDNVTNRTIEISLGKIYDYKVPYTKYLTLRQERKEQQKRSYENQQRMIEKTEEFIERFRYKATKAVQVQSRIKQLSRIERIEIDEEDTSHLNLRFPPAPRSGDFPIIVNEVSKSYGDHLVFSGVNFSLRRGEKVAFVGKNGEGKSTLVKCIMNEIPFDGELKVGYNVYIGYFAQNQASLLDESRSVLDTIDAVAVGDIRTKIKDILGAFMFGSETYDKKVGVLSGGERTRLAMIRLLLQPVNLLILDEPTNHLDIPTKEILKRALKEFDGTAIIVSHDRDFLAGLVTKVYEFGNGKVLEYMGDVYDFLQKKKLSSLQELERKQSSISSNDESSISEKTTESKKQFEKGKEVSRKYSKIKKEIELSEKNIERLEKEISHLEKKMNGGEILSSDEYVLHSNLKSSLKKEMEKWERLSQEKESLER
ncbi:MAG TPA: glycosyl transferase family 2 [Porphyromonadaceae bacterium]|nr:glycosyl transferase family 2 [Porphyromonadaceae bacterium]